MSKGRSSSSPDDSTPIGGDSNSSMADHSPPNNPLNKGETSAPENTVVSSDNGRNDQKDGSPSHQDEASATSVTYTDLLEKDDTNNKRIKGQNDDEDENDSPVPTMTWSLFFYWILPITLLSIFARHGVDTSVPKIPIVKDHRGPSRSIQITPEKLEKAYVDYQRKKKEFEDLQDQEARHMEITEDGDFRVLETKKRTPKAKSESSAPTAPPLSHPHLGFDTSSWPTSYVSIAETIRQRRPHWYNGPPVPDEAVEESKPKSHSPSPSNSYGGNKNDPRQQAMSANIDRLFKEYDKDRSDIFNALAYADAMRQWGITVFDGGSYDQEAIDVYTTVVVHLRQNRKAAQRQGLPTDKAQDGRQNVPSEVELTYREKSIDGLLCSVYTSLGKLYFMADMFEQSEKVLTYCHDIEPNYLEARNARGSTRIVMGKFDGAAQDYAVVVTQDVDHLFSDAYSGLTRVLEASEASVPSGWDFIVSPLNELIKNFESALSAQTDSSYIVGLADGLRRFHHALFVYNDKKTKDYSLAWDHLTASHKFKLMTLPGYLYGTEKLRVQQMKKVFGKGFWPDGMGSTSKAPIFVIGFARSGSTLLERVLDAHPSIAGLGENSVFNGRLDSIRQRFVEASEAGGYQIISVAREAASEVAAAMKERWELVDKNTARDRGTERSLTTPLRFVDKMLSNYFNVGFIQMMFPDALILHVIREPMDTIFSAFKHDFPADRLAYTSDEKALAELYTMYRETMVHWEEVLPGRITHVRYEDMVEDMPGMARAIIDAAGLPWHDSVLDFHKQKHYVNTYSSTQVRKKVYKDAIKAWKRYEKHLGVLVDLLGEYVTYDQSTTLPNYKKSASHDEL